MNEEAFPDWAQWLAAHPRRLHTTYGFALFTWRPHGAGQRPAA